MNQANQVVEALHSVPTCKLRGILVRRVPLSPLIPHPRSNEKVASAMALRPEDDMALSNHERVGKAHSMLALWHLFSGRPVTELPGIDAVRGEARAGLPKQVRRVVPVGNKILPGQPVKKDDGTD